MQPNSVIWVTFDKVGFHRYPQAPDEVAYLRETHRHVFKFKVTVEVFHDDRDLEFHLFKTWLVSLYNSVLSVDFQSCEMIARDLLTRIQTKFPGRWTQVDVSEDGECGATITC